MRKTSRPPPWLDTAYDLCRDCVPGDVPSEIVSIEDACLRVAAQDLHTSEPMPQVPYAVCRGHAMRASDTAGATAAEPVDLASDNGLASYIAHGGNPAARSLRSGACQFVPAGIPLPENADAVVPSIEVVTDDVSVPPSWSERLTAEVREHANVLVRGGDYAPGALLVERGERITAQSQAVLIAAGVQTVTVFRRPRIGIVLSSYDTVPAPEVADPWQRADATGPYLQSLLARWGHAAAAIEQITPPGANGSAMYAPDAHIEYVRRLSDLISRYDLLIGVGMPADSMLLASGLGGPVAFPGGRQLIELDQAKGLRLTLAVSDDRSPPARGQRTIYRPGSSTEIAGYEGFAYYDRAVVLNVPGYTPEVAATVHVFIRRILHLMEGAGNAGPEWRRAALANPITRRPAAHRFLWGVATNDAQGRTVIEADDNQTGLHLRTFATANALVAVRSGDTCVAAGESVDYVPLD